jgi:hypothetical protein
MVLIPDGFGPDPHHECSVPKPPSSARRQPKSELPRSLADRVEQRVAQATQALERTRRARRPSAGRLRRSTPAPDVEQASLRAVFRELGDTHRQYRARTGQAGTPALREAAHAFKRAPTLPALVTVAAFFDELGLLAW